jgi:hypothetical protein
MKKIASVLGMVAIISTVGFAPAFGGTDNGGGNGGQNNGLQLGRGTPAPEIGASVLGMLLASGVAIYLHRRRRG